MHALPSVAPISRPVPAWAWITFGGIALGFADLAFAATFWFLHSGIAPIRIPQSIAGWVVGPAVARSGGIATALAGAALYAYVVAAMIAGYLRLSARRPRLRGAAAWWAGGLYGLAMYALLFRVVLPLFAAASPSTTMPAAWTLSCLVAYWGIGMGCAWIARAYFDQPDFDQAE
jgi:hypothetical protein